jgi:hypothetical protein
MKLEHLLQLAEWLAQGLVLAFALCPVDSVNDRTRWPIPRASLTWGTDWQHSRGKEIFFLSAGE